MKQKKLWIKLKGTHIRRDMNNNKINKVQIKIPKCNCKCNNVYDGYFIAVWYCCRNCYNIKNITLLSFFSAHTCLNVFYCIVTFYWSEVYMHYTHLVRVYF